MWLGKIIKTKKGNKLIKNKIKLNKNKKTTRNTTVGEKMMENFVGAHKPNSLGILKNTCGMKVLL